MAARPTQDAWLAARQRWESDPTETFESISKVVKVSRVAVSKKADKEGWQRPVSLHEINQKAQLQADLKVARRVSPERREVTAVTGKSNEQAAVDVRVRVIETHRADWWLHRDLFPLDKIAEDFEVGKQAKISAEMLMIRQKGERDAYGLSQVDAHPPSRAKPPPGVLDTPQDTYRWLIGQAGAMRNNSDAEDAVERP